MGPVAPSFPPFAVVLFGSGRLPAILLSCLQFRLVIDLAASGRASENHLAQLHVHLRRQRCPGCRAHLVGRASERTAALRQRRS
jgi:hypothetical protein